MFYREVLQLRPEVRDSPQVRSALQFVTALNSGNYVLFFKLAKKNRDYLQCCLLQHYFQQVRTRALRVMVHTYGKNSQVTQIICFLRIQIYTGCCFRFRSLILSHYLVSKTKKKLLYFAKLTVCLLIIARK